MPLALFDLDNTLLQGDSDYAWGEFLVEKGMVDAIAHQRENDRFYQQYLDGELDINEFLRFQLRPLAENPLSRLEQWRNQYLQEYIRPMISPQARALVEKHRARGDIAVIITATNSFVTRPIADLFGVEHLIATEPEMIAGEYTGGVSGLPSYREGKVIRLREWLSEHDQTLADSWFYSDSHNDLPLLESVENPVAVNPDARLQSIAKKRQWPILHLS
ncbi:MAG: HAD-IB family hydrolase [Gammaproteobacteria bacterium]|nr:MAG: HAD-IB family hydrolase [Gammaproteobacteria bacterium]